MNIVRKPSWMFGIAGKDTATTIGTTIYMPEWYYDPNRSQVEKDAIVLHEESHVKQFNVGGWINHSLQYVINKNYRRICELEAYEVQVKHLKNNGYEVIPERWARIMEEAKGINKWITYDEALAYINRWVIS
jgi:hypothetical protein